MDIAPSSFHYLFKFIVIGDSGNYCHDLRRGEVMLSAPIYRTEIECKP